MLSWVELRRSAGAFRWSFGFRHTAKCVLCADDLRRRVLVTLWQTSDSDPLADKLIGATSFGIFNIASGKTVVDGWYWMLHDIFVGRNKHQVATPRRQVTLRDLPLYTIAMSRRTELSDVITRATRRHRPEMTSHRSRGYGLTLTGSRPCVVGRVEAGSAAAAAGVCPGDVICRINGHSVVSAATDSVARIIRHCPKGVVMQIRRPVGPPTAAGRNVVPYTVTDDVSDSSSDEDDDDSSLHMSTLCDDVINFAQ